MPNRTPRGRQRHHGARGARRATLRSPAHRRILCVPRRRRPQRGSAYPRRHARSALGRGGVGVPGEVVTHRILTLPFHDGSVSPNRSVRARDATARSSSTTRSSITRCWTRRRRGGRACGVRPKIAVREHLAAARGGRDGSARRRSCAACGGERLAARRRRAQRAGGAGRARSRSCRRSAGARRRPPLRLGARCRAAPARTADWSS